MEDSSTNNMSNLSESDIFSMTGKRTLNSAFRTGSMKKDGSKVTKGEDIINKEGSANVGQTSAFWFSPELTSETWLLPKSRQEILKWVRIYFNLEPFVQCLSGDTKISLLNGQTKTINELYKENAKDIWLYSISPDGQIVPGKVKEVKLTRQNADVIKIILDNDKELICTPDHKIMLRNGEYKEAKDLIEKDGRKWL